MCGIIYYTGKQEKEKLTKSLVKIKHRGPDSSEIIMKESGIGFVRLAIMDPSNKGDQPFQNQLGDVSVTNGEIYNYHELKKSLKEDGIFFSSESDCEVILPLYRKYGIEGMVRLLDGEYATIIYDKKESKVLAARDQIGIRPLFYGYQMSNKKIAFASEVKGLIDTCEKIMPFPPGHYFDGNKFIEYEDITKVTQKISSEEEALQKIQELLIKSVTKRLQSDVPIGFLLSGGLDSSLVVSIAKKIGMSKIKTFAIGMEEDPIDLEYAKYASEYLNTNHTEVKMSKKDVLMIIPELIKQLETYDITTIRASIGMYILSKYIRDNTDIKVLITGEVSDEIFGYKYTDFAPNPDAFQKESEKRIKELHLYDVLRADRCIAGNSLEARVPFSDQAFVRMAMSIDPELKINNNNMGKHLLRKAFDNGDFLPGKILWRDKEAFSDAVGHSMVDTIKGFVENEISDSEFKKYQKIYPDVISKESMYYHKIFLSFYPRQLNLIPGYWMPNQEWFKEKINDPSARVLSNYQTKKGKL
jgi:asparagine synthase (glutamine-hydrolysing)